MKKCTKCGEEKPLSDYPPDKRVKSGVQARCRKCIATVMAEHREKNPENQKQILKRYYENNKDKVKARVKEYAEANADKVRERYHRWLKSDRGREVSAYHNRKRRARKAGVQEDFTSTDVSAALERADYKCQKCGISNEDHKQQFGQRLHMDHIKPLNQGHALTLENCQVLCRSCNSSRPKNA